jgi:hypothetical protein
MTAASRADCGTSLPEQDAKAIDPGNPRRCLRSIKWTKARDGFVHGKPAPDARAIDPGNPRRCLWSIKWTKARDGFVHGLIANDIPSRLKESSGSWHFHHRFPAGESRVSPGG